MSQTMPSWWAIPPNKSAGCASAGKNWMNKDSVKPADKLLMLSSKVMLDFDTFWTLQFGRDQGVPAPLNPLPLEEGKFHFFPERQI
jgi:hypothetical protein